MALRVYIGVLGVIALVLGIELTVGIIDLGEVLYFVEPDHLRTVAGVSAIIIGALLLFSTEKLASRWKYLVAALILEVLLIASLLVLYFLFGDPIWFGAGITLICALSILPIVFLLYRLFEERCKFDEQLNYFYTSRAQLEDIDAVTNKGVSLRSISSEKPVMLVFLRHFGCTFCRESMATISRDKDKITASGTGIVIVHMSDDVVADKFLRKYHLSDVHAISDPDKHLYESFALEKGGYKQLFGLKVLIRAIIAGIFGRHSIGRIRGDYQQLPGVFLFHKNKVIKSYRHYTAADTPDYVYLAQCNTCN